VRGRPRGETIVHRGGRTAERRTRQKQKGGRKTEPPQHRQRSRQTSDAQPPPRQVILLPPSLLRFVLFPTCRTNIVLHAGGWGGNNSPPGQFCCWARLALAQPCLLGRVWPRRAYQTLLGRDRPNPFWAEIGPTPLGLSPAQLVGPAQPSPFNIIYYILYCFVLFIYVYMF